MTYDLYIGDRTFSSWSLRGWLMFVNFDISVNTTRVGLYSGTMAQDLAPLAPARLVPVMRTPEGVVVGDTMAMGETLAERHPEAGLWPADPAARAMARWMVSEMHSGFNALRGDCPMQLLGVVQDFTASDAVLADVARIEDLWARARTEHGADGPWLFGACALADVFYAPIAARLAGFGLMADQADTEVGRLSGGQKARLSLLLATIDAPHLLILDEPTNHLDIEGQEALEAELIDNDVSCLLVSHDRTFLRNVGNRFWWIKGKRLAEIDDPEEFLAGEMAGI